MGDIGNRLKAMVRRSGLSYDEIADRAGTCHAQICRVVNGTIPNPGIRTVARIVEAAGGTMSELFADGEVHSR